MTTKDLKLSESYCPFCARVITASNTEEVESGEHDGFIFVHDDVEHDEDYNFGEMH